ncbi:ATP synthase F0 subunit A [Amycolatopsis suaedae]|uniref:ATP synthase subunit a n=1 Tax=Amycolatopsis suaedae TaxID=2510978 RepID=A0A4Q7J0Q1_9PSEU|nr:ATP synthase F0 subunit A [Amycolatopsis suaedae]
MAEGGEFVPPGAKDFDLGPIFGEGTFLTKPMLLAFLSTIIVASFFLIASRRLSIVPSKFQFVMESVYDFGRNNIARDQIGSKDFRPYVPLILALFTFVLVNNLFGFIPFIQFPTMSHIGFPLALSVLIVYPLYWVVGVKRFGFAGFVKNQVVPPGAPGFVLPLLVPIEIFVKFFMNPATLALRVFAAMFSGHLLLMVFTLGGEYLLIEAGGAFKPLSVFGFAMALAVSFLEALIQVLQAYIFALLAANYIGMALSADH